MIHVLATLIARPDTIGATRELLASLVAPSRAEPGCDHYQLFQSTDEPARFQTVERWHSAEAMQAHLASPHLTEAFAKAADLLGAEPIIQTFEEVG